MKRYLTILLAALGITSASAQATYKNPVYGSDFPDPTVQRAPDGTFYAYATGCQCQKSSNLTKWSSVSGVLSRPTWNDSTYVKDGNTKTDYYSMWAADVNYVDGKYICYYASALWGNGSRTGIGVAVGTSPSKFTDKGKVFRSTEIGVKNSIDPCYVEEFDKKYLVWGSFNDICIAELTEDGLAIKGFNPLNNPVSGNWTRHKGVTKIAGGAFEGAMIYKRGSYYYLFCSVGSCCEGANSTYRTVVGRATNIKGPYVNKQGGQMTADNYTTIISGNERWKGPGHNSEIITDDNGDDWLLYHSYDTNNGCKGRLMLLDKITWDDKGWPTVNDGHPSSDAMPAPVFYTGDGANITYKFQNMDLMYSGWKGWNVVASEDCVMGSGKGSAFMPLGYATSAGTFDCSQSLKGVSNGLYEMTLENFSSEGGVDLYINNVATPAFHPAAAGLTAPTALTTISNNFLREGNKYKQTVYGYVHNGTLTFGMRSRDALAAGERYFAGNVKIIFREKNAEALTSVLNSYYAMAEATKADKKPFFKNFEAYLDLYKKTAEETDDVNTRYTQLQKIHLTLDSISTSKEAYAQLDTIYATMTDEIELAKKEGYYAESIDEIYSEAASVIADRDYDNKQIANLVQRMQTAIHNQRYSFQKGDGTKENPYIISRPDQLDHMRDVMIKKQLVYFEMDADVDMTGYNWEQINSGNSSYNYWMVLDGKGHIIYNLTPDPSRFYPSFVGTLCGEIRNVGFVNANVENLATGAAVIAGCMGNNSFVDEEGNLRPVIVENCYVTGSVIGKGYVGAIGGTLANSPIIIRNCYSAAVVEGNGGSANYVGGLVGRVRAPLTIEKSYTAGDVTGPVAAGIVAGGQLSATAASTYNNVIAWNKIVSGAKAESFGFTAEGDVLSDTYTLSTMLVNDAAVEGGKSHTELLDIAGKWGAPWYADPYAGNGYPILQWQFDRGDYKQICGFSIEDGIENISQGTSSGTDADGAIYDISGRRITNPTGSLKKGLYIIGGKKVLTK